MFWCSFSFVMVLRTGCCGVAAVAFVGTPAVVVVTSFGPEVDASIALETSMVLLRFECRTKASPTRQGKASVSMYEEVH
jgi:hypothetical protein